MDKKTIDNKANDRRYVMLGLRITGNFGAAIAIPVVTLASLGKYLDGRFGTRPWLTIMGFVVAAALSAVLIRRKAEAYGKEYQAIIDSEKTS
jgi:F0F1-type ATP synthase assembly protein I